MACKVKSVGALFHPALCTQSQCLTFRHKLLQNSASQLPTCLPCNICVPSLLFLPYCHSRIFPKSTKLIRIFQYMVHSISRVSWKSSTLNLRPRRVIYPLQPLAHSGHAVAFSTFPQFVACIIAFVFTTIYCNSKAYKSAFSLEQTSCVINFYVFSTWGSTKHILYKNY